MAKNDMISEIPSSSSDMTVSDVGCYNDASGFAPHGYAGTGGAGHQSSGKMLGVVHPTGRVMWVPYEHYTTLSAFKTDVAGMFGIEGCDFNIARATPLLTDTVVDYQCMQGEILYVLPKVGAGACPNMPQMPQHVAQGMHADAQGMGMVKNGGIDQSGMGYPPSMNLPQSQGMGHAHAMSLSSPLAGFPQGWQHMGLDDKIQLASMKLLSLVNNSKVCTELQACLEAAHGINMDCSPVFRSIEECLADLVVHPAGNYLVTKCFDWHVALIEQSAELIVNNLRFYALHKHASYVIEAILTHPSSSHMVRHTLINQVMSPTHRVAIATSDCGNFVIQKAIETCPNELLQTVMEAVQSVSQLTQHGTKMQKKLQARIQHKGPHVHHREAGNTGRQASRHNSVHSGSAYSRHNSMVQQQQQQQQGMVGHIPQSAHFPPSEYYPEQTYDQQYYMAQQQAMPQQGYPQQQQHVQQKPQQAPSAPQPQAPATRQYNPYAMDESVGEESGAHAPYAVAGAASGAGSTSAASAAPTPQTSSPGCLPSSASASCDDEGETSANQSYVSWADMDA